MCGIVSIIRKDWAFPITYSGERIFKQMLFANALRGTDGTGLFWKDTKKDQVFFDKAPLASWEAFHKLPDINQLAGVANWVVGHNRKATMGVHTYENTHPFCEGDIVLVHNGTLSNLWELEKDVEKCAVDSQAIAKLLDKYKPKQALEMLEGAYALVWYNTKESKLYYARNTERPLWLVEAEHYYFLVSEAGLAHWIAERNDTKIIKTTEIPAGKIYSLMVNKANKLHTTVTNFTPKVKKYTYTAPSKYSNYHGYDNDYENKLPIPYIHAKKAGPEKWFTPGDTVLFTSISSFVINGVTKIRGRTLDKPIFQVETTEVNPKKELHKFGTILEGTVLQVKFAFNSWVVECTDVVPRVVEYKSNSGVDLTDRVLNQLECKKCVSCNTNVTNDPDEAYVYYNSNTQEHDFLCPSCDKTSISGEMRQYGTV